jgi:hypothetical protein
VHRRQVPQGEGDLAFRLDNRRQARGLEAAGVLIGAGHLTARPLGFDDGFSYAAQRRDPAGVGVPDAIGAFQATFGDDLGEIPLDC